MKTRWLAWTLLAAAVPFAAGCTGKPRPRGDGPPSPERPGPQDEPGGRRGPRLAAVRGDYSLEQTRDNIRRGLKEMSDRLERGKQTEQAMHVQMWAMQADIHLAASKAREEAGDIEGALKECMAAVQPPMGPGGHGGPGGPGGPGMKGGPGGPGGPGKPGNPDEMRAHMKQMHGEMERRLGELKEEMRRTEEKGKGPGMDRERGEMIRQRRDAIQGEAENLRREMEKIRHELEGGPEGRGGPGGPGDERAHHRKKIEQRIAELKDEMRGMEKKMKSEEVGQEQRQMMRRRRAELEEEMNNLRREADKMDRDRGGPGPDGDMTMFGFGGPPSRPPQPPGPPGAGRDRAMPPAPPEPPGPPGAGRGRRSPPPPDEAGKGRRRIEERQEFHIFEPDGDFHVFEPGREGDRRGPEGRRFEYRIEVEPGREPRVREGRPFRGGPDEDEDVRMWLRKLDEGPGRDREFGERVRDRLRRAIEEDMDRGDRPDRDDERRRDDRRSDRPGDEFGRWARELGERIGGLAREWEKRARDWREGGGPERLRGLREQIEKAIDEWRDDGKESRAHREKEHAKDKSNERDEDKPAKKDKPKKERQDREEEDED